MIFLGPGLLLVCVFATVVLALITVGVVYAPRMPVWWAPCLIVITAILLTGVGWFSGTIFFWLALPVLPRYARKDRVTIVALTLAPTSWLWPMQFTSDIVWSVTQHPFMIPLTLVAAVTVLLVPTRVRGRREGPVSPPTPRRPASA